MDCSRKGGEEQEGFFYLAFLLLLLQEGNVQREEGRLLKEWMTDLPSRTRRLWLPSELWNLMWANGGESDGRSGLLCLFSLLRRRRLHRYRRCLRRRHVFAAHVRREVDKEEEKKRGRKGGTRNGRALKNLDSETTIFNPSPMTKEQRKIFFFHTLRGEGIGKLRLSSLQIDTQILWNRIIGASPLTRQEALLSHPASPCLWKGTQTSLFLRHQRISPRRKASRS